MKFSKVKGLTGVALMLSGMVYLSSCETDDVEGVAPGKGDPRVSISASKLTISEDSDSTELILSLDKAGSAPIEVTLNITGTASGNGVDYSGPGNPLTIETGQTSASYWIRSVQDTSKEGNETIIVGILGVTGAVSNGVQSVTITLEDDDTPQLPNVLLNEILYDPSNSGLDGDANGDGIYAQKDDEFVELINMGSQPLDMSGFKLYDAESLTAGTPSHVIPANTIIQPGKALVVFGGGTPTGSFGNATVQTSTSGDLNLNNAGDVFTLTDANGTVLISFDITPLSDNPNESYTRNPDLTGDFEQHTDNFTFRYSPGTKVDGSPF